MARRLGGQPRSPSVGWDRFDDAPNVLHGELLVGGQQPIPPVAVPAMNVAMTPVRGDALPEIRPGTPSRQDRVLIPPEAADEPPLVGIAVEHPGIERAGAALARGASPAESLAQGTAAACATVTSEATELCDLQVVEDLLPRCTVTPL